MGSSTFPTFTDGCASLLKKHLTKEIWEALQDRKTATGFAFADLIRSGVEQEDSAIGMYAGDSASYDLFAPLLDPVLLDYHGSSGPHPAPDFSLETLPELNRDAQEKIISTRVRVGRNLAGFPLGPAVSSAERREVEGRIKEAMARLPEPIQGAYHSLSEMDETRRQDLMARHLLFKSEDRFLTSAGLMRDWPDARGIFLSRDEAFSVWVNEEDQLRIIAMKKGGDVTAVFRLLAQGVSALSRHLDFLSDPRLGFLTSCPTNLGTAMRASVHMRLTSLAADEAALKRDADALGLQIRGIHGEHSQSKGGVFDISNRMRLGVTEAEAITHLMRGINHLARLDAEAAPL